jgi:ABC-type phosphate transport system substrate-binding protein
MPVAALQPLFRWFATYDAWIMQASLDAGAKRQEITYSYESSSSTEGKLMLLNRETHFSGVESALTASQSEKMPEAWVLPVLATAVAIVFNLPDYADLELTIPRQSLADIFLGRVSHWSNLSQWNPRLKDVHQSIDLVVRSDFSGTSETLTSALSSFSSEWKGKVGTSSKPNWPAHAIRVKGSKGVAVAVRQRLYSLGYLWLPDVQTFQLCSARIKNSAGESVAPSPRSILAAMDAFIPAFKEMAQAGQRMFVRRIVDPKNSSETWVPEAYPISVLTYLAFDSGRLDCRLTHDVLYLLYWAWRDAVAAQTANRRNLSTISWNVVKELIPPLKLGTGLACGGRWSAMEQLIFEVGEKCQLGTHLWRCHARSARPPCLPPDPSVSATGAYSRINTDASVTCVKCTPGSYLNDSTWTACRMCTPGTCRSQNVVFLLRSRTVTSDCNSMRLLAVYPLRTLWVH